MRAFTLGGPNIRSHSAAHLEPDCLLDFNLPAVIRARLSGIPIAETRYLLITHSHADHLEAKQLTWTRDMDPQRSLLSDQEKLKHVGPRFSPAPMLHVYGTQASCAKLQIDRKDPDPRRYCMLLHRLEYFEEFEAGDMSCIALKAKHGDGEGAFGLNYIIKRQGKTILYALDTGWFPDESLEVISGFRYDLVVLEATFGDAPVLPERHMNLSIVEKAFQHFVKRGFLNRGATFAISHMCPHWTPVHNDLAPRMKKLGITVAYDGLAVDL
jgi:phosphoribosyl 1,2-cyclic phosphate phosphodiesterase